MPATHCRQTTTTTTATQRHFTTKVKYTVASWLVRSSPDQTDRVRALAGDIVLYFWARHLTLTVPLSPRCINGPGELNAGVGAILRLTAVLSREK